MPFVGQAAKDKEREKAYILKFPFLVTPWLKRSWSRVTMMEDIWGRIFFFFLLFRAAPTIYGSSQARGQIGAAAAGLHHSHSNTRSEPHL